jgi:hypothetical protein
MTVVVYGDASGRASSADAGAARKMVAARGEAMKTAWAMETAASVAQVAGGARRVSDARQAETARGIAHGAGEGGDCAVRNEEGSGGCRACGRSCVVSVAWTGVELREVKTVEVCEKATRDDVGDEECRNRCCACSRRPAWRLVFAQAWSAWGSRADGCGGCRAQHLGDELAWAMRQANHRWVGWHGRPQLGTVSQRRRRSGGDAFEGGLWSPRHRSVWSSARMRGGRREGEYGRTAWMGMGQYQGDLRKG